MKTHKIPKHFISMDVESIGLHGEGFAVAAVELDNGQELDVYYGWAQSTAKGPADDLRWVQQNVVPHLIGDPTHATVRELRDDFWRWLRPKLRRNIALVGDWIWPVETNFMSAVMQQDLEDRKWKGPTPFYCVASLIAPVAFALDTLSRNHNELPAHNPLADARHSGRILIEATKIADQLVQMWNRKNDEFLG